MATTIDTFIDTINMSLDDYYHLTSNERERLYENLFRDKTDEEVTELRNHVEDEIDAIYEEVYYQQRELENIIDSKNTSAPDSEKAGFFLAEVEKMISALDSFSSDWGNAKTSKARHNIDVTDGSNTNFRASVFVTDGEEFVIKTAYSGSGPAGTPGIFGDLETDEDETSSTTQDIGFELRPEDRLEIAHYNPDSGEIRFAVTTPQHVTYYVTIRGEANIRLSGSTGGLTPSILASWPTDLISRMYESPSAEDSLLQRLIDNPPQ